MSNQSKPRLSDVAKKNTVDRASKLASGFIPAPPVPVPAPSPPAETTPEVPAAQTLAEVIEQGEKDFVEGKGVEMSLDDLKDAVEEKLVPVAKPVPAAKPAPVAKERPRRSSSTMDLAEVINLPAPDGLRCTRMIMLADEHHDMLRELSFKFKKPMTVVLYNLLETANQALLRDQKKGD
jgi:hypothetical protein